MQMLVAPGLVAATFVLFLFLWLAAFGVHVLEYALRIPGLTVALAVLPEAGPWLHWHGHEG